MELTPAERLRRRRSVVLLLVFSAITVGLALYPSVCTYVEQPQGYWPAYSAAPRSGAEALPPLVPPSATEIHTRRDERGGGRYWLRFTYAPADHDRMVAGLRRLTLNEARGLQIDGPRFTLWWTVNQRTMLRRVGERLEAYQLPAGNAWLVLDPSSRTAFYWSLG